MDGSVEYTEDKYTQNQRWSVQNIQRNQGHKVKRSSKYTYESVTEKASHVAVKIRNHYTEL